MPITLPFFVRTGLPLFPGEIGAEIWITTGRQTKSTKRIAGKAAQQTENQQLTAERQILARKTKCDLLGLCCDLTASDGPGTWI